MTTRDGHEWLVVHDPRGHFVARRDSPAAKDARLHGATIADYETLGEAMESVRATRVGRRPG